MRRIFVTFIVILAVLVLGWRVGGLFAAGLFVAQNDAVPLQVETADNDDKDTDKDKDDTKDKDKEVNPYFTQLVSPDRSIERQIEQMERLIKVDRHTDVVRIIGSLLENSDRVLIPPPYQPRNNVANNAAVDATPEERTTNTAFTKRLLEIFKNLPDKAKETYNIQYKTQADSLLESAIKQGSFETLQKVAQKYLFTDAGVTALFLVGMYQLELGDWESALLTFDKVNYIADQFNFKRESFEPALSLSIAACQIRLDRETEAVQTLDKFIKKFPRPRILTNGKETRSPTNSDELFSYVKESIASRDSNAVIDWIEHTGWLLPRGVPSQNPETAASSPLLETVWEVPNFNQDIVASLIRKLYSHVQSATETYIHALQPLVVGNFVITRGVEDVTAVDIDTGKRVWYQSDNDYQISPYIIQAFQNIGASSLLFNLNFNQGFLRSRIWHDRIANSMSSDGERLFYIGEHNQRLALRNRNLPPLIINNKAVENPLAKRSNTLIARDAKTGNLLWRAGKFNFVQKSFDKLESEITDVKKRTINNPIPPAGALQIRPNNGILTQPIDDTKPNTTNKTEDKNKDKDKDSAPLFSDEELFLSETLFLGAPLPLHGRLYCVCESEGLVQLLVLNSSDGKLLSKVPLAQISSQAERGGHLRYLYGLTPSAANGIIFCPTGLGMIFAIDATTVTPLWCFSYEQTPTQEDTQDPNRRQLRINMVGIDPNVINNEYYRQLFEQSGWQVPSIMIDGSRVLIAPPDLPVLYCVDSLTGKLLWQVTNLNWKNTLYIACIHNKIAYVVTPVSVLALSMDSGQQVWEQVLVDKTTTANVNNSFGNNAAGFGGIQNLQIQIQVQINPNIIPNQNQIPIPVPIPVIVPKQLQFNRAKTESAVNNNNDKNNNATVSTVADNSAAKLPKLVFPARLRPVGVGVHNGNFYYVPLSDGYIGVINLAECSMRLVSSPESVISSEKQPVDTNADENQTTSNLSGKGFNIPFGNLIGLRGKFFSQSPSQLTCFDQWLDLNERTEELLKKNPNDALGLLRLGKIRRLENNMNEAVLLFRRSLQNNPSEVVTYHLRQTLIEAIKNDFKSWKHFLPELESLALTPDERGEILYAKAQGEAKDDNVDEFASTIAKIFNTESELHTNVTLDNTALNTQLHNMTAVLIDQIKRNYNNPHLSQKIDQTANEIFNNIRNNNFNSATSRDTESVDSVKEMIFTNKIFNSVLPQVRRWRTFVELFRTLPIAEEARELLRESYTKDNFHLATEMLLDLPVSRSSVDERSGGNVKVQKMERLPKLAEMQQLASQFETHGVVSDAYYYYKLIADLYGEKGKEIANNALQKNTFKDYNKQNTTPKEWSKGDVSVQIDSIEDQLRRKITPKSTAPVTINTYAHAILRLARGGSNLNARPLMFIGEYEPFLSPYQYSVEFSNAALELAAYDQFGKECWQFDLSEHISEMMINRTLNYSTMNMNDLRFNILTHFLKGCDHLLVFAYGNKMIAIDTFGCGHGSNLSPRILWSKQLSNDYQFIEKRLSHEINPTGNINSQIVLQTASSNHDVMIHVSRNVICYREDDKIHGINPLTGDTMWTRNVKTQACSILGNRDSVFLFYPATRSVVAIEPFSGAEIKQGVLAGDILTSCGTNVIIDKVEKSGIRFQSLVSDLNDMFLDDAEIKLCSSIDDVVQNELFTIERGQIPVRTILPATAGGVRYSKPLADANYFAIFSYESGRADRINKKKRIFIYDLQNKSHAAGKIEKDGTCEGIDLAGMLGDKEETNFQVYKNEDKFIVMFSMNLEVNRQNITITDSDGNRHNRIIAPLSNIGYAQNMKSEFYMLYDKEGNQCWKNKVNGNDWFLLQSSMQPNVPVFLYAAAIRDHGMGGGNNVKSYIGIAAVDKTTGRKRFQKTVPYTNRTGNLLFTKLNVDHEKQEIKLHGSAEQIITIKFEDDNTENKNKEEKETVQNETIRK